MRGVVAAGLAGIAIVTVIVLGNRARQWNEELGLASPPIVHEALRIDDPRTPRLSGRVVLVIVDGLGVDESATPYLDELRRRGVAATARVPYPTISRPNYVTILSGVPPADSGVRANRVAAPIAVDTVMDRVHAADQRVATASDFGLLASLFVRGTPSLVGVDWIERGTHVAPPPPLTWPFDDAIRVGSLDALGSAIAELAAGDAALVAVLVLDVDRAGHAAGVGDEYRAAAAAADHMLRRAFAGIDLTRDTVIVTADHGHVRPGGHGGDEPEVSHVPLVLAGSGVVAGATARDARLVDVAPTVAALLGIPAPGHAEGRALVELLQLTPEQAARRSAIDTARGHAVITVAEAARAQVTTPSPRRLVELAIGLAMAVALGSVLGRRKIIVVTRAAATGALGFAAMLLAAVVLTRGQLSPSYVPSLSRTQALGAVAIVVAIVLQLLASWRVIRRAPDRIASANGCAFLGLTLALAAVGLVRAWFSPPHLAMPPPFWMVVVPALDIAAATCAFAALITLALAGVRSRAGILDRRSILPTAADP
jgi:hypothetical protein